MSPIKLVVGNRSVDDVRASGTACRRAKRLGLRLRRERDDHFVVMRIADRCDQRRRARRSHPSTAVSRWQRSS